VSIRMMGLFCVLLGGLLVAPVKAGESSVIGLEALPELADMAQSGLLLLDHQGRVIKVKDAQKAFVPASTTKLVTAFLALSHWGEQHRFKTDFFVRKLGDGHQHDNKTMLYVKGYGDPFLISEELTEAVRQIKHRLFSEGIKSIDGIVLDTGYFADSLVLPGTGHSDNPYDAIPSAIAANFNTLFLRKDNGRVLSAEEQTPLTPLARTLGQHKVKDELRFNTGDDPKTGQRYFAELLATLLRQQGVQVGQTIDWGGVDSQWPRLYRHYNQHTLADIVRPMMRYSTNFIANQLALMLSVEFYGEPATERKVALMYAEQLAKHFNWNGALIEEGAGLSRQNRLTPQQLVEVLEVFRPWKHLLPEVEEKVFAKSGSLIGVSALAGYIEHRQDWLPFVLMINQQVPYYHYRNKVALTLSKSLAGNDGD